MNPNFLLPSGFMASFRHQRPHIMQPPPFGVIQQLYLQNLTKHNARSPFPRNAPMLNARAPMPRTPVGGPDRFSGHKRKNDSETESVPPDKKKVRTEAPPSEGNFLVPVNKGTEQITVSIWDYFLSAHMNDEDFEKKLHLRKCLYSIVNAAFPNCRLFIVGSSMTGFATKTSDVDLCLMITDREVDQKRDAVLILTAVERALRQCSFMRSPLVIKAKVPILKFLDNVSKVECDLNINNIVGVRNTHLLRAYAYMDWRVRPLMLFIKKWARFHDINDASKKTVSSYSLTLMLIHYLQAGISPPVLPCLQKLKPNLFNTQTDVRRLSLKFDEVTASFTTKNTATLGELFLGFLNYYGNIFKYDNVISVRTGGIINSCDLGSNSVQWKYLRIEEPFDRSNTARSVFDGYVFTRILRVFTQSFSVLERTRDVGQLFVRPF
ncbi:poly(A) RNA polymerase GLD2-like [Physella acuta]|uniref:poly(A) RNA polymerase GLD2-like n=1 Tax=Physella acuta TaxID=109671 RepID=UPI0027DE5F67|nr:poly(A) RNA polymerase GLD2-like [Physella acuta]